MRPLSSVNNGSDNSKQFILCLFIFSIREYSCNVSQTYLRVQKRNDCCIIFYCIFTHGNDVFLRFSQKNSKILRAFAPWTPTRALPWTHWGTHSAPQTPSWCFTCLRHVPFCFAKNRCAHIFSVLSPEEVSNKIFHGIYPVRLAIKFHNTAVLHSENLPSLWKEPSFCDLHLHPQLVTFKHPPNHEYSNYDKASYTDPFYHSLVPQSRPQGSPHMSPGWTKHLYKCNLSKSLTYN